MKKIFVLALAAAAMVSCSNNDLLEVNQEAIDFGGPFVENATRATDLSYSGSTTAFTAFKVYGTVKGSSANVVPIFAGDAVTGTVGSNIVDGKETNLWSCDNKQYWINGGKYNFAAVSNEGTVATLENGLPKTITYTADDNGNKDLLFATSTRTGAQSGNLPVDFTFNHLLAKAYFTVTSNTEGGYAYTVSDIQINGLHKKGTYTVTYTDGNSDSLYETVTGAWTGTDAAAASSVTDFGDVEDVTSADTDGKTNATELLLIPTTDNFTVSFSVTLSKNSTIIDTYNVGPITVTNDLVAGSAYNFNIGLSVGEQIQFTVTSKPGWTDGDPVTVL